MTKSEQAQQDQSLGPATPTTPITRPLATTSTEHTTTFTTLENDLQQRVHNNPPPMAGTEMMTPHVDEESDSDHDEESDMSIDEYDSTLEESSYGDAELDMEAELELQEHFDHEDGFEDYEDSDPNDLRYWARQCSICFDAPMDICLDPCRDQYCFKCFQRYATDIVMSSWGLGVTTLKCPVCDQAIPRSQWSRLVPKSVVDHYDRFNQPYRSFTRCCPGCQKEAKPCDHSLKVAGINYKKRIKDTVRSLILENNNEDNPSILSAGGNNDHISTALRSLLVRLDEDYTATSLLEIYRDTLKALSTLEQAFTINGKSSLVSERCHAICSTFTLLDMDPETWKQMQFIYIKHFPNTTCDQCHLEFCLQCGYEAHRNLTCEEAMRLLADSAQSQDQETVLMACWYINNSRRCPNCAIMIDRTGGCNRVDCSLCGYCFCWTCLQQWSAKCGFFLCQSVEDSSKITMHKDTESGNDQKSELGVPDISSIEARLAMNPM